MSDIAIQSTVPSGRHDNPCPCGFETFEFAEFKPAVGFAWMPDGSGSCSFECHYGGQLCFQWNISDGEVGHATHTDSNDPPISLPVVNGQGYVFGVYIPATNVHKAISATLHGFQLVTL